MASTLEKYLARRAVHAQWPLSGAIDAARVERVVVIPALAESAHLFDTLDALSHASVVAQEGTVILCVVNNRDSRHAAPEDRADNAATLRQLADVSREGRYHPMQVTWVDASSEDKTLPAHEGVGLARKIGLDHGLFLLAQAGRPGGTLVCLDADAPPARGYLEALRIHYQQPDRWAGYAAYRHRLPEASRDREAIIAYEIYMRYHEISLLWAGSPYAYPALGSIISCTAEAYAAAGGMNRRLAGEDFYFMQQLTKTGPMHPIPHALVCPSGRSSHRTPFGTGRSVAAYVSDKGGGRRLYHPACYAVLRSWFDRIKNSPACSGPELCTAAHEIHPELAAFLSRQGFEATWEKLRRQHREEARLLVQFHTWFDGLRTIQLIHHLRDTAFPSAPFPEALKALQERLHATISGAVFSVDGPPEAMLAELRQACLNRHVRPGMPLPDYFAEDFLRPPSTT